MEEMLKFGVAQMKKCSECVVCVSSTSVVRHIKRVYLVCIKSFFAYFKPVRVIAHITHTLCVISTYSTIHSTQASIYIYACDNVRTLKSIFNNLFIYIGRGVFCVLSPQSR